MQDCAIREAPFAYEVPFTTHLLTRTDEPSEPD
jgi:hypothetical protein